ncbi:hypothetical protein B0F90DRAFT_1698947, partial [Multifurca ochricompacta]
KKRQKSKQVEAVVFDEIARSEFLTGFHKRKLAKKEESKKKALAREKQERLEARREQRRMLADQAAQNAAKVEEAFGGFVQSFGLEQEAEYSDEEQLATVTIVEDFDPSTLIHGTSERKEPSLEPSLAPSPPPRKVSQKGAMEFDSKRKSTWARRKGRTSGWKGGEEESWREETKVKRKRWFHSCSAAVDSLCVAMLRARSLIKFEMNQCLALGGGRRMVVLSLCFNSTRDITAAFYLPLNQFQSPAGL